MRPALDVDEPAGVEIRLHPRASPPQVLPGNPRFLPDAWPLLVNVRKLPQTVDAPRVVAVGVTVWVDYCTRHTSDPVSVHTQQRDRLGLVSWSRPRRAGRCCVWRGHGIARKTPRISG